MYVQASKYLNSRPDLVVYKSNCAYLVMMPMRFTKLALRILALGAAVLYAL